MTTRVQEVFHTPDHYYMVMDLYTGGDMYARYKFRSEADTAKIVGKLINALRYCHDRNVAVSPRIVVACSVRRQANHGR